MGERGFCLPKTSFIKLQVGDEVIGIAELPIIFPVNFIALMTSVWSNYSDLTRPGPPKGSGLEGKSPYFREIRLVKYYNLARSVELVVAMGEPKGKFVLNGKSQVSLVFTSERVDQKLQFSRVFVGMK